MVDITRAVKRVTKAQGSDTCDNFLWWMLLGIPDLASSNGEGGEGKGWEGIGEGRYWEGIGNGMEGIGKVLNQLPTNTCFCLLFY